MVIAGGCVSGILMRIGEGFVMQMVAFGGVMIGAFVGKQTQSIWKKSFLESGMRFFFRICLGGFQP